ncbi:hypothetical protein [Sphingomonas sp. BK235]|uniref:hypothetical protein n=1 Tax=Sphingomonas sp. BK235 TaxID=2512131 RepID=UPI001046E111|nr:hypothetical protein [Sphingomonas sp. BK235]TCP30674.1 hypothetical protein EV292_11231 [Sphingomonas sp. BK235]
MSFADRLKAANAARLSRYFNKTASFSSSTQRRGHSPVRRHSQYPGEREARAWRQNNVFTAAERRARMTAVREWNYREKKKGAAWGPLGPSGERFLDFLMGMRCFTTGRLDMAIKTMAEKLVMSVQTVCNYVERLVSLGLLTKIRRMEPVEEPEPGGPQVKQITNAYWFELPAEITERVRQIMSGGGKPVDQEEHERAQAELVREMVKTLSAEEMARFYAGDGTVLAEALARLGSAVDRKKGDSSPSTVTRSTR